MVDTVFTRRELLRVLMGMSLSSNAILAVASRKLNDVNIAKKAQAKFELRFASPYDSASWRTTPHMHQQIKQQIELSSHGEIYVSILDKGIAGIGPDLMKRVSHGYVSGALVSASNLSPVAPVLDVLNIPFWCADNQSYLNLITSSVWQAEVVNRIKKRGVLEVMFPYVVGSRTITSTRLHNERVAVPADLAEKLVRIPTSKVLKNFYEITDAKTVKIPWGEASQGARDGNFQFLDPSVVGLNNGPNNLRNHLGTVSLIDSVQDSWLAVINQQWLAMLPKYLQQAVREACDKVFKQQFQGITGITSNCVKGLEAAGVTMYQPTEVEKESWMECCGHQHRSWDSIKRSILKDDTLFPKLLEAAQTNNGYHLKS